MQLQNSLVILSIVYIAVIGVAPSAAGITSAAAWVSLGALALLSAGSTLIIWSRFPETVAPALQLVRP